VVAFDAATENIAAADPQTFLHTPVGTPRGVWLICAHGTTSAGIFITNNVTYGGVLMASPAGFDAHDVLGEVGASNMWFLGSNIPTGAQTVSVDRTEATTSVHCTVVTLTAARDTEAIANGRIQNDAANPQVLLAFGGRSALSLCGLYGGGAAPLDYTSLAGHTRVHDHDFGTFVSVVDRLTTAQTSDDTCGYTAALDDVAFVALAVAEVAAGVVGDRMMRGVGQ